MDVLIKAELTSNGHTSFLLPIQNPAHEAMLEDASNEVQNVDAPPPLIESIEDIDLINEMPAYEELQEAAVTSPVSQHELDEIKENARAEAYRDGYEEGVSDVRAQYGKQLETFDSVLTALSAEVPKYLDGHESIIASIVFESVCKIVGEVLVDQSKSLEVVKQAISKLDKEKVREIFINPSDLEAIEDLKKSLSSEVELSELGFNQFVFKVDPSIRYGGCKIKLLDGYLNATIDGQLAVLSKSLITKVERLAR